MESVNPSCQLYYTTSPLSRLSFQCLSAATNIGIFRYPLIHLKSLPSHNTTHRVRYLSVTSGVGEKRAKDRGFFMANKLDSRKDRLCGRWIVRRLCNCLIVKWSTALGVRKITPMVVTVKESRDGQYSGCFSII